MALTPHSCFNSATHRLRAFFFFNDTATTEIYTLSLHDALPISNKHFFIKDAKNPYVEDKPFTWIQGDQVDRKSTRLNSSHSQISYAVFCLKKKNEYPRYRLLHRSVFDRPDAVVTASSVPFAGIY